MSDNKFLYELVSPVDYLNMCNKVLETRKEEEDGRVVYREIEYTVGDTLYKVQGYHFPVQDVIDSASSNCKVCNSKGYTTINVPKSKLPDPSGYFVEEDTSSEGKSNFWRITTPCECGVKNVIKKYGSVFTIDTRCVFVDISFSSEPTTKPKVEIAR